MGAGGLIGAFHSFTRDPSVTKQKVKPGTAKRMFAYALPYKWLLILFLVVVIFEATARVINPLIYRDIINNGILKRNGGLIIKLAVFVAGLAVLNAALGLLQSYLSAKIGARIVLSLRTRLFDHIQQMPLAFFTRAQTGALVSRLENDVSGARSAFTDILSNVVGNLITIALTLVAMFALSWQITLVGLLLIPLLVIPARVWGRKLQAIMRERFNLAAAMNSLMVERFNVAGAMLSKLFGRPQDDSRAFEAKAARVADIGVKSAVYGRLFFTAMILMMTFATTLAYGWGGVLVVRRELDLGTLVALSAYLSQLVSPMMGLSNMQVSIMTALVSFERVFEVLDLPPMIREKPGALPIAPGALTIAFDHVSFRYPMPSEVSLASLESVAAPDKARSRTVLDDISFRVEPGQLVALVGPSGAGKTTITHLVPRLYDVQSGSVSINGLDVRDATLASIRERIGVVTQDAHLFHDSIRANLQYGKPDGTDAEIHDALAAAQILPLIQSLPNGLDTQVGERGYRFSGGEKQRLAIARLLLKAPEIVILDEATAHLDSESEAAIQKAFETALAGRTSLVIAHRLSTILRADQILVINEGRIVERGTHSELLTRQGLYTDLYQRQFASPVPVDESTETQPSPA